MKTFFRMIFQNVLFCFYFLTIFCSGTHPRQQKGVMDARVGLFDKYEAEMTAGKLPWSATSSALNELSRLDKKAARARKAEEKEKAELANEATTTKGQ